MLGILPTAAPKASGLLGRIIPLLPRNCRIIRPTSVRRFFFSLSIKCFFFICAVFLPPATAPPIRSVYHAGSGACVSVIQGPPRGGECAPTGHGEGDNGYDHFHIYLTDAVSGKKIGALEEIVDALDTGADAFCAKWSNDSKTVTIIYRVDQLNRYLPLRAVSYRISERAAHRQKGPFKVRGSELFAYYQDSQHETKPSPKVFGAPFK